MPDVLKKALSHLLTPPFVTVSLFWLCLFHVVQMAAVRWGGPRVHQRMVEILNGCLLQSLRLLGNRPAVRCAAWPPSERPLIVVANHQSTLDVIGLGWYLRRLSPCFVAKRELGRGIPSVSYNLRHSGAALIDRNDARQALTEIGRLGMRIGVAGGAAVIFPEGTRSRSGDIRPFAPAGVKILMKKAPQALVLPVCIHRTWRLNCFGKYPLGVGERFCWSILPAIDPAGLTPEAVIAQAEAAIRAEYARLDAALSGC